MFSRAITRTFLVSCLLLSGTLAGKVPTVYDVLQLVYQVCSTDELHRQQSLSCVSEHMGKEVLSAVEGCLSDPASRPPDPESSTPSSVKAFCEQMTHIPEWAAKHPHTPPQLTRVMGLAALGRMACVLGEVNRPLPMWQAAFKKCFPNFQSAASLSKDSTKNRSENILQVIGE